MKQYIKKADIILLIVLVAIGLAATVMVGVSKSSGDTVLIENHGDLFGKYSLHEDREIDVPCVDSVGSDLHVSISGGTVKVTSSGCANQLCVKHSAISRTGESIICLPNRIVVKIEGKGGGYDAITS